MIKQSLPSLFAALALTALMTGCSSGGSAAETVAETTAAAQETAAGETAASETAAAGQSAASEEPAAGDSASADEAAVRVGSLKGPTSMGLVSLMEEDEDEGRYAFTMVTAADELVAGVASGKVDIALVPANVASVLYNRTEGGVSAIDINTLGVLYLVTADSSVQSVADLKGRTVYLTGKGTTPDYVAQYLLRENGLTDGDVTLEYKSEATEVAAILKEQPDAIGLLPQPFVTVACAQNETLHIALDLTAEWDRVQGEGGSRLVTGVTIVRDEFLESRPEAVNTFLDDHQASVDAVLSDPGQAAGQIVKLGIIEQEAIAEQALPYCNITFLEGEEMKAALSGYLNVLSEQDPASVGGALPGDDFYYFR